MTWELRAAPASHRKDALRSASSVSLKTPTSTAPSPGLSSNRVAGRFGIWEWVPPAETKMDMAMAMASATAKGG